MRYDNRVVTVSNYATKDLEITVANFGKCGYRLTSTEMAKNKYGCIVMYLFFEKELDEKNNQ